MDTILNPKRIIVVLSIILAILTLAHFSGLIYSFHTGSSNVFSKAFDFDEEKNFSTYYSGIMLLFAAILLALIGWVKQESGVSFSRLWLGLGVIFLLMSMDEMLAIHDHFSDPVKAFLPVAGIFYFAWVIPYFVGCMAFLAAYARFIFALPGYTRVWFIISGLVYVGGAMGVEMVNGIYFAHINLQKDLLYMGMTTAEELMEMTGTLLFIHTLLQYIDNELPDFRLRISSGALYRATAPHLIPVPALTGPSSPELSPEVYSIPANIDVSTHSSTSASSNPSGPSHP